MLQLNGDNAGNDIDKTDSQCAIVAKPRRGMGRPRKLLKTGITQPRSAAGAGLESINSVGQCRLLAGSSGGHS